MKCAILYKLNIKGLISELFKDEYKCIEITDFDSLVDYFKLNRADFLCVASTVLKNLSDIEISIIMSTGGIVDTAIVAVGDNSDDEKDVIRFSPDAFFTLNDDKNVVKYRLEKAINSKRLIINTREKSWVNFAAQHNALSSALFVYEYDLFSNTFLLLCSSTDANKSFYPFECYTDEKMYHKYAHPDDIDLIRSFFSKDSIIKASKEKSKEAECKYRILDKNNNWIWVESVLHCVEEPFVGLRCFAYVKLIDADYLEKELYEQIISENVDFIFIVDIKNDLAKTIFPNNPKINYEFPESSSYSDTYKKYINKYVVEEYRKAHIADFSMESMCKNLENNKFVEIQVPICIKDKICYKEIKYFYEDNKKKNIVIVRKDITSIVQSSKDKEAELQKALNQANTADRAKSSFLAQMSHDIRTPLNAILGMASLAKGESTPKEIHSYLDNILTSGNFLLGIINDILDVSRAVSGKLVLSQSPYSVDEFIDGIITNIKPHMDSRSIYFKIDMGCGLKAILTDSKRLNQLFFNLLTNAAKYTQVGGEVVFSAKLLEVRDGADITRFSVKDNGIGMSEEFVKHAFEPFSREAGETDAQWQGTGLGLTIVKEITDAMGGKITIDSKLGVGTNIMVDLPLIPVECCSDNYVPNLQLNNKLRESRISLKGKTIILAEDNNVNMIIAKKLLEKEEINVIPAIDGQICVEKFEQMEIGSVDAILMDVRMPRMDGYAATKAIRALKRSDAKFVPIIAMTANAYAEDVDASIGIGMNAHLTKPIEPDKLVKTIAQQIESSQIAQNESKIMTSASSKDVVFDFTGYNILLADDNDLNREMEADLLGLVNFKVDTAINGVQALDMFEKSEDGYYDYILMDIQMPIMDGYEATKRIRRSSHPQSNSIPIVALTANAFEDDVKIAHDIGMNAHIAKPIDSKKMFYTLLELQTKNKKFDTVFDKTVDKQ